MTTLLHSNRSSLRFRTFAGFALLLAILSPCNLGCKNSKPATDTSTVDAPSSNNSNDEASSEKPSTTDANPVESSSAEVNNAATNNTETNNAQTSSSVANDSPPADSTEGTPDTNSPTPSTTAETEPQTWSTQRIAAILPTGPVVIDILVNVDGHSLEETTARGTQLVIERIERDLKQPWTWEQLLDHPLIVSGWLGNLLATTEQRAQVIAMYNMNSDETVDETELAAFLSRGLTRSSPLKFTDLGNAPNAVASSSPWQPIDLNQDTQLDATEISQIAKTLARFDYNADRILTFAELERDRVQPGAEMTGSSAGMLENKIAFAIHPTQKPKQAAAGVLQRYTILESVDRQSWPSWSDAQWAEFDENSDGKLVRSELERIVSVAPNFEIKVQFHNVTAPTAPPKSADSTMSRMAESPTAPATSMTTSIKPNQKFTWTSREKIAGQIAGESFTLAANINDSFTVATRSALRSQLSAAFTNPQIAAAFRSQLQLSENAFEVLDTDGDSQLDDEEFDAVWLWFTTSRGSRVLARWFLADSVWFQLADADGDSRLTEAELQRLPEQLTKLDANADGLVSPSEIPVAARLEIVRTDNRLNNGAMPAMPQTPAAGTDWFAATDSNSDGLIGTQEFLGTADDFSTYDADKDGFISSQEAYKAPTPQVQ